MRTGALSIRLCFKITFFFLKKEEGIEHQYKTALNQLKKPTSTGSNENAHVINFLKIPDLFREEQ